MEDCIYEYDQETLACLAGFEKLWNRVSGRHSETHDTEEERLLKFIREECSAAAFYSALSRMFQNPARSQLMARAADAKRRSRRLRAEYFILAGLTCDVPRDCPGTGGKLASLRAALETEQRLSTAYAEAAEKTPCPILKELYHCFSRESATHAQTNRALLLDCF